MEDVFDPLKFYDELKAADVPEKQAKAQAEAMRSAFAAYSRTRDFATKGDIQDLRLEIRQLELRLSERIEAGKHEILKWLIGLLLTQPALLIAIFALQK